MGRRRRHLKHLAPGMQLKHGAYYYLARIDGKQKWIRLSDDFAEAMRKYADLVGGKHKTSLTISDAISHYLAVRANDLKPDTISGYQQSARRLAPVFGHMELASLQREHVYRYLVSRGNVAANRDRALLSAVYTHFLNSGVYKGTNPCTGLHYRNPERARQRYISDEELEKIVATVPRKLALMVRWSYLTAMREKDMLALTLNAASDIGVTYTPSKARKNNPASPRTIIWTDELREVWRAAAGIRIGPQPLFPTAAHGFYTRDSFQSLWQRWRKKLDISDLRWHDIRRKAGSDSLSDAAATELLAHRDGAVTQKHYRAKPKLVRPLK